MTSPSSAPIAPPGAFPFWRRLLMSLAIGLLATFFGSAVGAFVVGVIGAFHEGAPMLRAVPALVLYGTMLGPVLAWPVTLVVLPAGWLFFPSAHRRLALMATGTLAGGCVLAACVLNDAGPGSVSSALIAAGAAGGLVGGAIFGAFPRPGNGVRPASKRL